MRDYLTHGHLKTAASNPGIKINVNPRSMPCARLVCNVSDFVINHDLGFLGCDAMRYCSCTCYQRFGEVYHLLLQGDVS